MVEGESEKYVRGRKRDREIEREAAMGESEREGRKREIDSWRGEET